MASPSSFRGDFLRMYGAKINISSSYSQRTIIDAINLTFLVCFYLSLLLTSVTKQQRNKITPRRRSWPFLLVSIACALVSSACVGATIMALTAKDERSPHSNWVVHIVRGFIWFSLGISSLLQGSKWVRILSSLWWVSFFVLISGLNINVLFSNKEMEITDVSAWPLNLLLFFCALKDLRDLPSQHDPDNSLSQPLLNEKPEQRSGRKEGKPGFFSWLTFSWINPLLRLGYSKPLGLDDIPPLLSEDEASLAYQRFTESWDRINKSNNKSSNDNNNRHLVIKAIARVYLKEMIFTGVGALLKVLTVVASPLLLHAFIEYSKSKDENLKKGLFLLTSLICIKCLESLSQRHWFFQARRTGMRMRSALMVAVYQKQLKISSLGRKRHSVGEIVNYIAVDAYRMSEFPWWFHYCWTMFLQLFLGIGVLFFIMGMGALPGLLPLFLCCFLNVPYAKLLQKHRTQLMKAQDERLRATSEALNNMKVIKLNAWEERFKALVESLRVQEFKDLSALQYIRAAGTAVFWLCPTIISSIIFLGCAFLGSAPLNATTVFTVLVMLRSMSEPMRVIPESLSVLIQVKVSFDRINSFLLDDDLKHEEFIKFSSPEDTEKKFVLKIENGSFSWDFESTTQLTLRDINLEVQKGMKVAICGPVGAGKSSLLYAILKEIPKVSGTVGVYGSIAYVAQTSWIQSGTVRENILYGKPMNQERYQQAIRVAALDKDIHSFSHGDLTEIGQRGINLSGGQKQRIQLARAVYSDADIYLLDDPFSAVDALTAAVLFHDCVIGALARKTVFLVTHQVEFLSGVDKILVMEEGQITQSGSYDEILTDGTAFEQLVNAHKDSTGEETVGGRDQLIGVEGSNDASIQNNDGEISTEKEPSACSQLTEEEEKEIGDSLWNPFIDYILISRGLLSLCSSILSQTGFVIFQAMATYWLAYAVQTPSLRTVTLISVYAGISTCSTIFVFFRAWFAARLGLQASKAFFSDFHQCIFRAPMLFFDSTPVGRIFTRVSSDFSILDNDISFSISLVMAPAIETIGIVAIMASVTWQVLIVVLISVVASNYVLRYYLASAREIVRINGTTKAPVMNYTAETSLGVTTIRAFKSEDRFFRRYLKLVDTDAKLFFHSNASTEWLVMRLEVLQNITLFTATFFLLLLPKDDITMAPGMVGLSLSYGLTFTNTQVFMSRWFCNLSNYIISVERIKQFMHIQPEPPAGIMDDDEHEHRPPGTWPSKGRIVLRELTVRYRPNAPLVLKGVSCTFKEGSRVGVVGRTGSGKTTLISALFRLVEAESGKILIDGLDICSMGLKDLRSKLSIIPQEPMLFRGSVRSNLDPLGLYSDKEIWEALEKCQLKTTISGLPNQLELESSVTEQGENWSAGERQLFCLGRVLLRKNKILVLDEATASIDSATDAILQRIIREEFRECTVITVAHRVPTVIDSDMVMVLSFGRIVEYEQPDKLLQRRSSSFAELVNEYYSLSVNGRTRPPGRPENKQLRC